MYLPSVDPSVITRFAGALLLAYFMRLLLMRLLTGRVSPVPAIWGSNLGSLAIFAFLAGFLKAGLFVFAISPTYIYVVAQAVWLAMDLHLNRVRTRPR